MKRRMLALLVVGNLFIASAALALADHQEAHNPASPPGCAEALAHADEHAAEGLIHCGEGFAE